jgi:hypothetical protein
MPDNVVDVPVPLVVAPPGFLVMVQLPAGRPVNSMLPVVTEHVGCVMTPIVGGLIVPTSTVIGIAVLIPQLVPVTLRVPVVAEVKLMVIVLVFPGGVIVYPDPV